MSDGFPVRGLVLAGGESRRMGSDKALLRHGSESQLDYSVRTLRTVLDDVRVSARESQAHTGRARYPLILDGYAGLGPMAGILSAMDADGRCAWLILACDLPNVTTATLEALLAGRDPARAFTAFRSSHNDLPEPLCAIYEPGSRHLIDEFLANGITCPRKMMMRSDTALLTQPDPGSLDNINTPEDLARSTLRRAAQ